MLKAEGISKTYPPLQVLRSVDFHVNQGEVVTIEGASGAGKSTLLHIVSTLDEPDQGRVELDGVNPFALSSKGLALFRNKNIGFVFQFHNLLPEFSALENIMLPGMIAKQNMTALKNRAHVLMKKLGVSDRAQHKPSELSGGEAQRVAVARALINSPKIVFADEPSGNLDSANAALLHRLFIEVRNEFGHTFVIVTHNSDFAALGDRHLMMRDGQFVN
ncbi:MAG: lipoprotein-releasing system ATP-binding protein LolD [Candidatus Nephrothrix sp. EaCA]|nr:MAG: lipoprotein-releasing system ATP-binding protein LolD [Candidatus Nephrothrix sp. EaCA]